MEKLTYRMRGKQHEVVREDGAPYYRGKLVVLAVGKVPELRVRTTQTPACATTAVPADCCQCLIPGLMHDITNQEPHCISLAVPDAAWHLRLFQAAAHALPKLEVDSPRCMTSLFRRIYNFGVEMRRGGRKRDRVLGCKRSPDRQHALN